MQASAILPTYSAAIATCPHKCRQVSAEVQHGNGAQTLVQNNSQIAYCSLHQSPLFPGTGKASDRGSNNNVLNLPLLPGSTIAESQPAFEQQVIPFLTDFKLDLLIVSAGYDATYADPSANMALEPKNYGVFTKYCLQATRRIVFGLEGGYDLDTLAQSVVATIETCSVKSIDRVRTVIFCLRKC